MYINCACSRKLKCSRSIIHGTLLHTTTIFFCENTASLLRYICVHTKNVLPGLTIRVKNTTNDYTCIEHNCVSQSAIHYQAPSALKVENSCVMLSSLLADVRNYNVLTHWVSVHWYPAEQYKHHSARQCLHTTMKIEKVCTVQCVYVCTAFAFDEQYMVVYTYMYI